MSEGDGLLVRAALLGGESVESLQAKYALRVRRGVEFPNLCCWKYDQVSSPMHEPLVQQCRGLILDEADGWAPVSRPFDKWFNLGEPMAASVDWETAQVEEKLDGSLIQLFWYRGRWRAGTSGTPDGVGGVEGGETNFAELFWKTWQDQGSVLPDDAERVFTFMFELTTPLNRVVVQHSGSEARLIGVRHTASGQEYHPDWWAALMRCRVPESYPLADAAAVQASFAGMSALEHEGYVVVDEEFRRVKVKNPEYVRLHKMRDGFGTKAFLAIIQAGETPEALAYFPEMKARFMELEDVYGHMAFCLREEYERIASIPVQKDFAFEALKTTCSGAMFKLRAGKVANSLEFLSQMSPDALQRLLGVV